MVYYEMDREGIGAILNSDPVVAEVQRVAEAIGADVKANVPEHVDVRVERWTGADRAHFTVLIADPSGQPRQLKHGVLTAAAGRLGLTVRSR